MTFWGSCCENMAPEMDPGLYSYRHFLHPMHIPNQLVQVFIRPVLKAWPFRFHPVSLFLSLFQTPTQNTFNMDFWSRPFVTMNGSHADRTITGMSVLTLKIRQVLHA